MYPRIKKIAGREYVYLVTGSRSGDKIRQKTVAYLGPLSILTFGIPKSVRENAELRAGKSIDWESVKEKIASMPVKFDEFADSRKRTASLKTRALLEVEAPVRKISSARLQKPSELLLQRAPGELEVLALLSKQSFESMFQQVGPYRYRLRRSR